MSEAVRQRLETLAAGWLARREHGVAELAQKLAARVGEATPQEIEAVLASLQQKGWLDERRYVESAVRRHLERGDGPLKIRCRIEGRLAEPWRLDEALDLPEDVWIETARKALEKRFSSAKKPREPREVARRLRFLQNRGFTSAQCWAAFE